MAPATRGPPSHQFSNFGTYKWRLIQMTVFYTVRPSLIGNHPAAKTKRRPIGWWRHQWRHTRVSIVWPKSRRTVLQSRRWNVTKGRNRFKHTKSDFSIHTALTNKNSSCEIDLILHLPSPSLLKCPHQKSRVFGKENSAERLRRTAINKSLTIKSNITSMHYILMN